MGLGPPSSGTKGQIFPNRIDGQKFAGQNLSDLISITAGHEIAHGVHLHHCPQGQGDHLNCYMWVPPDKLMHLESQFHSHHDEDYDIKQHAVRPQAPFTIPAGLERSYNPAQGTWVLSPSTTLPGTTVTTPRTGGDSGDGSGGGSGGTNSQNTTNSENIISTNTGSSTYGCDYNAEYDWCSDTGTCTTRTGSDGIGMCGHRWCCCAPQ